MASIEQRKLLASLAADWWSIAANSLRDRGESGRIDWNYYTVEMCVLLGDFEDRPVNASRISVLTTIPRTTVIRILARLVKRGVAVRAKDSTYTLSEARRFAKRSLQASDEIAAVVIKTGERLSALRKKKH